jgi:cyclophilin family peptidyl-prolyl cis-trans isomerase
LKKYRMMVLIGLALLALVVVAACAPITTPPTQAPAPTSASSEAASTPVAATPMAEAPTTAEAVPPDNQPVVPTPQAGERPLAELEPSARQDAFSGPAPMYVKENAVYVATIVTDKGNIVAELYQDTPEGLNNFVTLAMNGYYDGLTFHRVEPEFVIQGGDPAGSGEGGPGYTIPAEIKHNHPRGALAWARTGDQINPERRSSGSQFYITLAPTEFLDGGYSVFGLVLEGMDVADQIAVGDTIQRIDIAERATSQLPSPTPTPTPFAPTAQEGRPLATVTVAERQSYYNAPPEMTIDTSKTYQATLETDKGNVVVDLDAQLAPKTVNNFVMLANLGFYDAMPIAHVEPSTYIVLGSPASQPGSDVGYLLDSEGAANGAVGATTVVTGTVAMYPIPVSESEVKASGSQFFLSLTALPPGNTPLSIFGIVSAGQDVMAQLAVGDIIKSITISEK